VFNDDHPDEGERDGVPTAGEPNFDQTDLNESDQIGLTGFKMNRIVAGAGTPNPQVDDIVFFDDGRQWPRRLYEMWTDPNPVNRFDIPLVNNYNIGFFFASGPFRLYAQKRERFSLALAYGADLDELKRTIKVVQQIYNANYQFAVPPPLPTLHAETGDRYVKLSWNDVAERGTDPVTGLNDFEGYRIYRSTDPNFLDPKVISSGRGTGPLQGSNGRPIAQYDLKNGIREFSSLAVEGVEYYLGDDTGITHTWTDTTVTNGQLYYYAVTAYDHGADTLDFLFYPSENAITVTQDVRAGIVLPPNVVQVRPNPRVLGYTPAAAGGVQHVSGTGSGSLEIRVLESQAVPDNHTMVVRFHTEVSDSIRAEYYTMVDSTEGETVISKGSDLEGKGTGQVGSGLQPVITTPAVTSVDMDASGFHEPRSTNVGLRFTYQASVVSANRRRPGYPSDLTVTFANAPLDTSLPAIGIPAKPVKYRIVAHDLSGDLHLKTRLYDVDNDSTLSTASEYIDVITYLPESPTSPKVTWRIQMDTTAKPPGDPIVKPRGGDTFEAVVAKPYGEGDVFAFATTGESVDQEKAKAQQSREPYVVPNPYVAYASFEPERFAVSGRGERRIEFRNLPQYCTIRIYTTRGELVQTLRHDGSTAGMVAWDLRSKDNLEVAPGLYIFHVEHESLGSKIGKFAIIK